MTSEEHDTEVEHFRARLLDQLGRCEFEEDCNDPTEYVVAIVDDGTQKIKGVCEKHSVRSREEYTT